MRLPKQLSQSCVAGVVVVIIGMGGFASLSRVNHVVAAQTMQQPTSPGELPEPPTGPTTPPPPLPPATPTALATSAPVVTPLPPTDLPVAPSTAPAETAVPAAARSAFVTVAQLPTPNLSVAPGESAIYSIVLHNRGDGRADQVVVTVPFNSAAAAVVDVSFTSSDAWVSELSPATLELRSGPLASGAVLTATLHLHVLPSAPIGASLVDRLSYRWGDQSDGGTGRSNAVALVVGTTSASQQPYQLIVNPQRAPASTPRRVTSPIFIPFEQVTIWYDDANGVSSELGTLQTNADGTLDAQLFIEGLSAGSYTLVGYGNWSGLIAAASFTVE